MVPVAVAIVERPSSCFAFASASEAGPLHHLSPHVKNRLGVVSNESVPQIHEPLLKEILA